jgi:hypothetical protein
MSGRRKVWVLFHAYSDGGTPVGHRVYLDEERAREDMELAGAPWGGSTEWHLVEAEIFGARRRRETADG